MHMSSRVWLIASSAWFTTSSAWFTVSRAWLTAWRAWLKTLGATICALRCCKDRVVDSGIDATASVGGDMGFFQGPKTTKPTIVGFI